MPQGSGLPFSQARASGSALMYEVRAHMTSDWDRMLNNVAAAACCMPLGARKPGLSARNSGSSKMLWGLWAIAA